MRGMLVIAVTVALVTVSAGVLLSLREMDDATPAPTATPEIGSGISATPAPEGSVVVVTPTADAPAGSSVPQTPQSVPSADPSIALLNPAAPTWAALTEGLARTRDYYSEVYERGEVTVRWRPGAFPEEKADQVAEMVRIALAHDNALLDVNDAGPIEVLLADQMFAEECLGCQGFAAADLRQIFILQDGSVADNELQALITHEVAHVLAAQYIALPESLFFAEGLATWAMSDDIVAEGYVPPVQTAAWALNVGTLPALATLREGKFAGRMRARLEYDSAGSFVTFAAQTYGLDILKQLYALTPPEAVLGKTWEQVEAEWHAWLGQFADQTFNGVGAEEWWSAAQTIIDGYTNLYTAPEQVTQEQYAYLATSRLLLNRGDLGNALALAASSGLTTRTAQ